MDLLQIDRMAQFMATDDHGEVARCREGGADTSVEEIDVFVCRLMDAQTAEKVGVLRVFCLPHLGLWDTYLTTELSERQWSCACCHLVSLR